MSNRVLPKYRKHKASGRGIVTLPDGFGKRKDFLLPGEFGSQESKMEYARLIQLWQSEGQKIRARIGQGTGLTVAEMVLQFWEHAEKYYRTPDGEPTHEQAEFKLSLRPVIFLYGGALAAEFGPKAMQAVRNTMIQGYEHPEYGIQPPIARGVINRRVNRIKLAFKWAVKQELIPGTVFHSLQAVEGLRRGRSAARETEPVKPVPMAFVEQTIAAAPPVIGDMIQLQLLTGVRPGELVIMRGIDIDMSGSIWLYTPKKHKTQHLGHSRVIAIGPQGQAIIRRFLKADVQAPLFSPREAREERYRLMRAGRKTKVQPSQACRKKARPKKLPGEQYDVGSYGHAVAAACKKADVPHWHPHQLRHTRATDIRKEFGLDAARAVLGHRTAAITEVYAERDQGQAMEVMARIG